MAEQFTPGNYFFNNLPTNPPMVNFNAAHNGADTPTFLPGNPFPSPMSEAANKLVSALNDMREEQLAKADTLEPRSLSRYKTELCGTFYETGQCKYGAKCRFAHGFMDMRIMQRHPKYKTEFCRAFHSVGNCPYGTRCCFIHNIDEKEAIHRMQQRMLYNYAKHKKLVLPSTYELSAEMNQTFVPKDYFGYPARWPSYVIQTQQPVLKEFKDKDWVKQPVSNVFTDMNWAQQPALNGFEYMNWAQQQGLMGFQNVAWTQQQGFMGFQNVVWAQQSELLGFQGVDWAHQPYLMGLQHVDWGQHLYLLGFQDVGWAQQPNLMGFQEVGWTQQPDLMGFQDVDWDQQPDLNGFQNINLTQDAVASSAQQEHLDGNQAEFQTGPQGLM